MSTPGPPWWPPRGPMSCMVPEVVPSFAATPLVVVLGVGVVSADAVATPAPAPRASRPLRAAILSDVGEMDMLVTPWVCPAASLPPAGTPDHLRRGWQGDLSNLSAACVTGSAPVRPPRRAIDAEVRHRHPRVVYPPIWSGRVPSGTLIRLLGVRTRPVRGVVAHRDEVTNRRSRRGGSFAKCQAPVPPGQPNLPDGMRETAAPPVLRNKGDTPDRGGRRSRGTATQTDVGDRERRERADGGTEDPHPAQGL